MCSKVTLHKLVKSSRKMKISYYDMESSEVSQKQERILFELETILKTCQSIDSNIVKSIELLSDDSVQYPYNHVVQDNIETLKQILQLLEGL